MQVFLLGNGFDLYHSFPTRYTNFLHVVQYLVEHYDEKNMKTIGDIFASVVLQNMDKDIGECYNKHKKIYDETLIDKQGLNNVVSKAKSNIWFKYFTKSFNKELGWIDFEKEISNVIEAFYLLFTEIKPMFGLKNILKDAKKEYIFSTFDFFYTVEGGVFAGTNERVKKVKNEYCIENPMGSKIFEVNKEKIVAELYKTLRECAEILKLYLSLFVDNASLEMMRNEKNALPKKNIYTNISKLITFNYTHTFEYLYGTAGIIEHIHGDTSSDIVLGVNSDRFDEMGDLDTRFIQFKKYYQRVFLKTDVSYLKGLENTEIMKKYDGGISLNIVGHSLDITDEDIIKYWIENARYINIFYHHENAVGEYIKNLVALFGKKGFDNIRTTKRLQFLKHNSIEW